MFFFSEAFLTQSWDWVAWLDILQWKIRMQVISQRNCVCPGMRCECAPASPPSPVSVRTPWPSGAVPADRGCLSVRNKRVGRGFLSCA